VIFLSEKQSVFWKRFIARLMRITLLHRFMYLGIHFIVPRQRIGVALVAVDESERVFMLHHVFHPYAPWGLPGGWLKRNESPADGALRELKEETGLTAELGPPVLIGHDTRPRHIGIAYLAKIQSGSMSLSVEILDAKWFPFDDLPSSMLPFTRLAIETAVKSYRQQKALDACWEEDWPQERTEEPDAGADGE
jgi:8-oxo-dGTP diphosphatase